MTVYSGIMTRFLVYSDRPCRYLIGHGIRIEYQASKKTTVTSMHLFDNTNEELPEGHYFLGDFTDEYLVVIPESKQ